MLAFTVCGILLAVGHHLYYPSLDDKLVSSTKQQQWAIRFGTAFALLVQGFLAAAVAVASNQHIWTVIRRGYLTVGSIDKAFEILSDPTALLSLELAREAKLAILVAVIFWYV